MPLPGVPRPTLSWHQDPEMQLGPRPSRFRSSKVDEALSAALLAGEMLRQRGSSAAASLAAGPSPSLTTYENIQVCNSGMQLVDDFKCFHLHLRRATETERLVMSVASTAEQEHLKQKLKYNFKPVLVNVMVWRRSVMKVLVICMGLATFFSLFNAGSDLQDAMTQMQRSRLKDDFERWQARMKVRGSPHGFQEYSWAVVREMQNVMLGQAVMVQAIGSTVLAVLGVISLVLVVLAQVQWDRFRRSRQMLMAAWMVAVAAPFIVSIVPARLYVDWTGADELVTRYRDDLASHIGFDDRVKKLEETCDKLRREGNQTIVKLEDDFDMICGVINQFPKGKVPVPTGINIFKWNQLDLAPAHNGCAQGRELISAGKPSEVLEKAKEVCSKMEKAVHKYQEDHADMPKWLDYFAKRLKTLAETGVCMLLAVQNFATLFPAALSIAPGLLKGALRMKLLVPQSIVPGMFVILLPWLYCPLSWSLYSVIFQFVGNPFVLLGLLVLAFTPLMHSILGKVYGMDRPMTDEDVVQRTRKINSLVLGVSLAGYFCLGFFVVHFVRKNAYESGLMDEMWGDSPEKDPGSKKESEMLAKFLTVEDWKTFALRTIMNIIVFVCSVTKAYFLTGAAGADWMAGEMLDFYKLEKAMNAAEALSESKRLSAGLRQNHKNEEQESDDSSASSIESDESIREAKKNLLCLAREGRERMDELLKLEKQG